MRAATIAAFAMGLISPVNTEDTVDRSWYDSTVQERYRPKPKPTGHRVKRKEKRKSAKIARRNNRR